MSRMKKLLAILLALVLSISMLPAANTSAAPKVKLNRSKATIYVGKSVTLKLENNKKKVKWSSSNRKAATVSKKGRVTGKKAGKAVITAKVGKKKYSCRITVKKAAKPKTQETASKSTLKKLLQTAMKPVGETMYVWGGGWNREDTGAGREARTIGVSPRWKLFFRKQTASYDYQTTRYQISNGLDCSGYVGWCIYNIMNTTDGKSGYVMLAQRMAENFASRGWGSYTARSAVKNYRAGDIMSSSCSDCGHVWMVVGSCSDGSVVLLDSSPPGVQLAGTPSKSGRSNSEAVKLASHYMKKYFPAWYKKYPNCARGSSYLSHYGQMRWYLTGSRIMSDPDGYRYKSAKEILSDLLGS